MVQNKLEAISEQLVLGHGENQPQYASSLHEK
jgi:hypothetical protein